MQCFSPLLIQWGYGNGNSRYAVTLPIAFEHMYQSVASADTEINAPFSAPCLCTIYDNSLTQFSAFVSSKGVETANSIHWLCVGY